MADDINKGGGKVNGAKVPKTIQELTKQHERATSYEASLSDEKLQQLADKAAEFEERYQQSSAGSPEQSNLAELLAFAEEEKYQHSLNVDRNLSVKANKVLARGLDVYSKTGNINRRTTTMAGQQSYRGAAKTNGGLFRPTNMIESEIQSDIEAASVLGGSLADEARGLGVGASTDSINGRASKLGEYEERIARNKALLKVQTREGISTEKLTNRGEDLDRDVDTFFKRKDIDNRINSGGVRSYKEESTELSKRREERSIAQGDYEKAIETGTEGVEAFAEKLHKANEALDEQTRVVKGMSDKGMDKGGGIFGKYGSAIPMIQMGFQAVGAVAGAANDIAVNHDIAQMSNRAQFAKMGNSIYDKAAQAVSGYSVDAMLDVGGDQFVKAYADKNKAFTNKAMGVSIASNGAADLLGAMGKGAVVGAGLGLAGGIFAPVTSTGGAIAGAAIAGVASLANTASQATNLAYGNVGADASIRSYQAAKDLTAQERYVATQNMQAYYNQGLGAYQSIQGMGSGASGAMQKRLMDGTDLTNLARTGVSPEEAVKLTGILGQAGSMEGGSDAGLRMIEGAGRASQRGQMGKEEYVSAAARMVAAGGKDNELEDIISAGMTKGMDNSKNIGQMIDATLSMSSGLASKGISATGAVGNMLEASSQFLVGQGVNKNLAVGTAAQDISNYNSAITDTSFNLGNIMQRGGLRNMKELKGASVFQMNNLSSMSMEDIAVLQGGGKEAELLSRRLGVDNMVMKDGKVNTSLVTGIGKEAFSKMLTNKGALGDPNGRSLLNKFGTAETLTAEERAILSTSGGESVFYNAGGVSKASKISNENYNQLGLNLGAEAAKTKATYEAKKVGAGAQATLDVLGGEKGKEFEQIEKLSQSISEAVDPAKWGDEVKRAADGFAVPAANFVKATGDLDKTVEKLVSHQTAMLKAMGEMNGTKIQSREK
jgi:hypothetical protein